MPRKQPYHLQQALLGLIIATFIGIVYLIKSFIYN
jgi:hypothetical protein